jgi:ABC-2 type transport system ATP-binding protein
MSGTALVVHGLSKSFAGVMAVRDAGFSLERGRITAFLGENGAGKTTTIKMVLGFLRRDSGEIELRARTVGYVPEQPAFFPWIKGGELLDCTLRLHGVPHERRSERIATLCEKLSLDPGLLERRVPAYSQGNRKKFSYLQSLLVSPDLFIVDEPFTALDPTSIMAARRLFCELAEGGAAVFMSTHLISEVEKIYDDVIIIRGGAVILRKRREDSGPWPDLETLFLSSVRSPFRGV